MEFEKLERQLKLLELLTGNTFLTLDNLCERLSMSKRSLYRYIDFFRSIGFEVNNTKGVYTIELSSPFIARLTDKVRFTGSEIETMRQLLNQADANNVSVKNLKMKFNNLYGMQFMTEVKLDKQTAKNTELLYDAIRKKQKVILHDYYSPHSNTTSDRLVEPFKFIQNGSEVRCFEISSMQCKTFKVSRIKKHVEMLTEKWEYQPQHITYHTDIFGFSGEKQYRVKLRLGRLAFHILMEEFGITEQQLIIDDDSHWLFSTFVCNYQGIGRFVTGLIQDIDIIDSPGLVAYLRTYLSLLTNKLA